MGRKEGREGRKGGKGGKEGREGRKGSKREGGKKERSDRSVLQETVIGADESGTYLTLSEITCTHLPPFCLCPPRSTKLPSSSSTTWNRTILLPHVPYMTCFWNHTTKKTNFSSPTRQHYFGMEGRRDDLTTCERIEKKQVLVLPRKESSFSNPTNEKKRKEKDS